MFLLIFSAGSAQDFEVTTNQGPCLASVQKGEEDYSSEDHDFGSCGEAVICEEPSERLFPMQYELF